MSGDEKKKLFVVNSNPAVPYGIDDILDRIYDVTSVPLISELIMKYPNEGNVSPVVIVTQPYDHFGDEPLLRAVVNSERVLVIGNLTDRKPWVDGGYKFCDIIANDEEMAEMIHSLYEIE